MTATARTARTVQITNAAGLHLPAASKFVQLANTFACDVRVEKDGREVNGESIVGLLLLVASKGSTITISASGPDADAAVDALAVLVIAGFDETE